MKFKWNEEYTTRAVYSFLVLAAAILFYFAVKDFGGFVAGVGNVVAFFKPFIAGVIIAFLLARPMNFFESKIRGKIFSGARGVKVKRGLAIVITLLVAIVLFTAFISFVIPQLGESASMLLDNVPTYQKALADMINNVVAYFNVDNDLLSQITISWQQVVEKAAQVLNEWAPTVLNGLVSATSQVVSLFFGFVVSLYLLAGKEKFFAQLKKLLKAVLPEKAANNVFWFGRTTADTFSNYISGQLLDALALGVVCLIAMLIFRFPYALLISVIICITNVIPMIGPFIGAVPCTFLVLMSQGPVRAIWFVVLIIVLQQIDSNILNPRIIGNTTGLSGFWVVAAIFIGGGIGGIAGIIIAVPSMSLVYTLVKKLVEGRLTRKGLPSDTETYL